MRPLRRLLAIGALTIGTLTFGAAPWTIAAYADGRCDVPLAEWQPREALQKKLEAQGWTVLRIRADDGCYKVVATDETGAMVKRKFDPRNLTPLARGGPGPGPGHHHGWDDD
ncbi:PepSY domain-containing protein [Methyloraptor flagellatus]|jgi:hypothetical protein|uniref:PepSY domain-containing protein n=1 Tax=Methyloraptor flagellatus TaxID=3162530 RepID=A0AAU7X928_9HYPH